MHILSEVLIAFMLAVELTCAADHHYTTQYDGLNIDAILGNRRLVNNYAKCLLDEGRCNEDGRILKEVIPDALITDCAKCSETQRVSVEKIIRFLVKERRSQFDKLAEKYDPDEAFRTKYDKYLM